MSLQVYLLTVNRNFSTLFGRLKYKERECMLFSGPQGREPSKTSIVHPTHSLVWDDFEINMMNDLIFIFVSIFCFVNRSKNWMPLAYNFLI